MFRSGYVSIVGWPNVGKSTLLNAFLGSKLSIVSARPQTTRESILGILNEPNVQMVFVDTPGWLSPKDTFQSFMKRSIVKSIYDDADAIVWLLEPKPITDDEKAFGEKLKRTGKPLLTVMTKMDLAGSANHWKKMKEDLAGVLGEGALYFYVSAKTGAGLSELKSALIARLPEGDAYFPPDQLTDRWERFYVTELIREQIFKKYQEEVPHASLVLIDDFVEKPGRKDVIRASIIVETEGQKRIVIGEKGNSIKQLGSSSRKEIEDQLGRPVFLELVVKVKKNWREDPAFLKLALGLSA